MPKKDLAIITVSWNISELIAEQMRSVVSGCKHTSWEYFLVDNGSTDNSVSIAQSVATEFPDASFTILPQHKNLGFGAANNLALEKTDAEFVLFLNPDMRVLPGTLDTIVAWMREHKEVGIVSPKLLDEHGAVNYDAMPRRFPKLWEQVGLILKAPHVFPQMLHGYLMKGFDVDKEQAVDSVRGSFMLMRREFLNKTGWAFDPRFFIWYEDVDICREAYRHGFTVMYTPAISCIDYVGQSFKKQDTLTKQKLFTASMLTYFQKWEPWYVWMWIALFRPVGMSLAWLGDMVRKKR